MKNGRYWLAGIAVLMIAAVSAVVVLELLSRSQPHGAVPRFGFPTLQPSAKLPSGTQCARQVRTSASPEIRPSNATYNDTVGHHVVPGLFPQGDAPQAQLLAPLIDGDFTGTTQQILEWAACKWGIDQNIVFAQAAAESSWQQGHLGDWGSDDPSCPPNHGLGADGAPSECPESIGILQTKYRLWKAAWPGIANSTAMNADVTYAVWRSCFNGYEIWLQNSAPKTHPYRAGDLWGCIGRWYAGGWYTPAAEQYIQRVKNLLRQRVWEEPSFRQAAAQAGRFRRDQCSRHAIHLPSPTTSVCLMSSVQR